RHHRGSIAPIHLLTSSYSTIVTPKKRPSEKMASFESLICFQPQKNQSGKTPTGFWIMYLSRHYRPFSFRFVVENIIFQVWHNPTIQTVSTSIHACNQDKHGHQDHDSICTDCTTEQKSKVHRDTHQSCKVREQTENKCNAYKHFTPHNQKAE